MKKLMIALAAVALAGAAMATATFNFTGFDAKYSGYKFYRICTQNGSTESLDDTALWGLNMLFLSKGTYSTWKDFYAHSASITALTEIGSDGTASTSDSGVGSDFEFAVSVLAFNGGIAPGNEYVLFNTATYTGSSLTSEPVFDMSNVGVLQTGHLNTDAVPEPTSGLLMLVGMAGLALRRKRR